MKFADRLKITATGTSAATITFSAAVAGFRTLAQAIADGALVIDDKGVPFAIEDSAGNKETSLFTVTSATVLTRTSVLSSTAGGTTPATFSGSTLSVFSVIPADFVSRLVVPATLSGTYAVGEVLTATYPAGTVGTIQYTRTLAVSPFTKTAISAAVANAVNSLSYTLQQADSGFIVGVDCSNQVSGVVGSVVAAGSDPLTYSSFSAEPNTYITAGALRVAMTNSKRTMVMIDNPASNVQTLEYVLSTQANNSRNVPGTGWVTLAPGARHTITDADATRQVYVRYSQNTAKAITAASCSGTLATFTVPSHGITVGATVVRGFGGMTPTGYNIRNVKVTATDANTVTCSLLTTQVVATAFGYMYDASECVVVTLGETL